ncbi:MAG: sodium:proton antiporter NhaD [Bacteroides sp.]|nr:sodium:proton antiporter NhaD [Bacteroides sp.]MCM1413468.1 sodium:proton antiporter NhaD [Bacteroides sp.]MCM1471321.1 sodium:proton antiporter NhaD [Bacteroides sp.]
MLTILILIFVIGYLVISLEHPLKIDKTSTALLLGMTMWVVYALGAQWLVPAGAGEKFTSFLADNPALQSKPLATQAMQYILNVDIIEHLGDICQTILFLIGAMTIVELIDVHEGFRVITDRITTKRKVSLLWIIAGTTFIMSAILDNLTTSIVMIMLLRKLIANKHERWIYASTIVIAANSGGAWSPIGDVTTIMLWVGGNVTTQTLISYILLPSIVSMVVPVAIVARSLKGNVVAPKDQQGSEGHMPPKNRRHIFFMGVTALLFVPVFKSVTHLPPFIGMLFALGVLWLLTEIFYNGLSMEKAREKRLPKVIARVDMPSILFFLGILMAVAVLQSTGILRAMAAWFDSHVHNVYIIDSILGILSSIVDNVPLVAASMGMYPIADPTTTGYAANFVVDGTFWELLSYCAGVGGSILIIGSAAGVIAMGLEKISFGWYLRRFSGLALLGYLCGIAVYIIEKLIF